MVHCDILILTSLLVSMCVSPFSAVDAHSLSTLFSLSLSLFLSFFLAVSLCCFSRHHCDAIVVVCSDILSLPLFWSPHVPFCRRRALSLFLISLYLSLFHLSLSLSLASRLSLSRFSSLSLCCMSCHCCNVLSFTSLLVHMYMWLTTFCSRHALSLSSSLSLSHSFSLSFSLSPYIFFAFPVTTVMPL